jgi:hypothetical protein
MVALGQHSDSGTTIANLRAANRFLEVLILPYSIGQPLPQTQIGDNKTASTPFVTADGWVYFQGTDKKLWKVFNDGSQQTSLNNTTASMPFVTPDGWVYFQGTDNTLWKIATSGEFFNPQ